MKSNINLKKKTGKHSFKKILYKYIKGSFKGECQLSKLRMLFNVKRNGPKSFFYLPST